MSNINDMALVNISFHIIIEILAIVRGCRVRKHLSAGPWGGQAVGMLLLVDVYVLQAFWVGQFD